MKNNKRYEAGLVLTKNNMSEENVDKNNTLRLNFSNMLKSYPYGHTYSNQSRKHSEAVHLR